ncbi:MAG: hypothetical protein R3F37_01575 [Candidatus Competibacteraceae bacterium]
MLETIKNEEFAALDNTPFDLEAGGHRHAVRVAEIRRFEPHSERPEAPFAVILSASLDCRLPQGTYRLHHPTRGPLDLFMVPLGPDDGAMRYEIVFN